MIEEMIDLATRKFPKLAKAYEEKQGQGFTATSVYTQSVVVETGDVISVVELTMARPAGDSILLTYSYSKGVLDILLERELPGVQQNGDSNLLLSGREIQDKEFKRKMVRGYDPSDVDAFLDVIFKDYSYIERVLIQENKVLKEDIEKLRRK
ncbi:DivIVA domain-containing protein [Neobacillus sp. YIM B06451]|uniref:DivIVA domain-containing protein n=1 Tax=Neobacillus sp. YIM B06451 TaxID=3070994 RepID=UPI0029307DD0|nr:DivIVA domain-containing protein [Neobacillus sp. YIM B06451]